MLRRRRKEGSQLADFEGITLKSSIIGDKPTLISPVANNQRQDLAVIWLIRPSGEGKRK